LDDEFLNRPAMTMRIRIIQEPSALTIDGVRLDHFKLGGQFEVGLTVGAYLFAEGWAEWVDADEPAIVKPMSQVAPPSGPSMSCCPRCQAPALTEIKRDGSCMQWFVCHKCRHLTCGARSHPASAPSVS
jgi:hypothetical protein